MEQNGEDDVVPSVACPSKVTNEMTLLFLLIQRLEVVSIGTRVQDMMPITKHLGGAGSFVIAMVSREYCKHVAFIYPRCIFYQIAT